MGREVFLLRHGVEIWRGHIAAAQRGVGLMSTQAYFAEAWRLALQDGVVADDDAGLVQFRFGAPSTPSSPGK